MTTMKRCDFCRDRHACLACGVKGESPAFLCRPCAEARPDLERKMLSADLFVAQGGCLDCWNGVKHAHHDQTIPCPDCGAAMCAGCAARYGHERCAFCRRVTS